jgi:hypothetical protein
LGANEDGKKKELLKDARLECLKKLAGVSLLSHSTLSELQSRLAKVQTCFTLIKDVNGARIVQRPANGDGA